MYHISMMCGRATRIFGASTCKSFQSAMYVHSGLGLAKAMTIKLVHSSTKSTSPLISNRDITTMKPINLEDDATTMMSLFHKYDNFLFDCDGVLWNTDHYTKFDGIKDIIEKLQSMNKLLLYVTNNSMHARGAYVKKFNEMCGFDAPEEDVFCVAYAAACYIKHIAKVSGKCYLMGSLGMKTELDNMGIDNIGYGKDSDSPSDQKDELIKMHIDPEVESVLVGFDIYFNYSKICKAASYLQEAKCLYVATNDIESRIDLGDKCVQPLAGVMVSATNSASARKPIVIGKPYPHLLDCIKVLHQDLDLSRTLMIGDSLKTDVGFAHRSGMDSLLVLSGATTEDTLKRSIMGNSPYLPPTFYVSNINRLACE